MKILTHTTQVYLKMKFNVNNLIYFRWKLSNFFFPQLANSTPLQNNNSSNIIHYKFSISITMTSQDTSVVELPIASTRLRSLSHSTVTSIPSQNSLRFRIRILLLSVPSFIIWYLFAKSFFSIVLSSGESSGTIKFLSVWNNLFWMESAKHFFIPNWYKWYE